MATAMWTAMLHSISLLLWRPAQINLLEESVRRKFSDPAEVAGHRAEALSGLTPHQREFVNRHAMPGARVLDIGCAAGRASLALAASGDRVVAIDRCATMVGEAAGLARTRGLDLGFCVMDARALGFAEATFDTVLMLGSTLSYIPGRDARIRVLSQACRVLKPGGKLLVETQSRASSRTFRAFFAAMAWGDRLLRRLGRATAWELGDRFGIKVSAAQSASPVYFHMYEPKELESDLAVAGLVPAVDDTSLYLMHYVGTKPRHRRA
jgi:2-polyprenyl-3-methyl-5-hydroxy-6-metoxy-1,4-benzoquinol methylase